MTDPRNHVRPGQPLSLAAEQVNWINEQMRGNPGFGGGHLTLPQAPYAAMPCRNDTGAVIDRWSGVAISLAIFPNASGTGGTPQFERMPVLRGLPLESSTTSWGVAIEPIKAGQIGLVAVSGVVPAKVRIASASDTAVGPEAGGLRTISVGSGARTIYKESGTGSGKWSLVLLPAQDYSTAIISWSGSWPRGEVKAVRISGTQNEIGVSNIFADIASSCGERSGAVIRHGTAWYLIAAQFN